jgi:hypothetical protein
MLRDINPHSGVVTTIKAEDGKLRVNYQQNDRPLYERIEKLRGEDGYWKQGVKNNLAHVLTLSELDCMKLITEDGINPYTATAKELRVHLERNRDKYGHVFATRRRA